MRSQEEIEYQRTNTGVVHPRIYGASHPLVWKGLTYSMFTLCVALQTGALVLILYFAMQPETSRPADEGFPLYKNSRFESCATTPPIAALDCAQRLHDLFLSPWNTTYLASAVAGTHDDGEHWCEMAWCLRDFKIVPTRITREFIGRSRLLQWWLFQTTAVFVIYHFVKQTFFKAHSPKHCVDKGYAMWVSMVFTLISTAIWWAGFAKIQTSPVTALNLWFLSWVVTWRMAHSFHRHPITCAMHAHPDLRRAAMLLLYAVALLQLGASMYIFDRGYVRGGNLLDDDFFECLQEDVAAAPGRSTCSAAEICGRDDLFRFRTMHRNLFFVDPLITYIFGLIYFVGSAAGELYAQVYTLWVRWRMTGRFTPTWLEDKLDAPKPGDKTQRTSRAAHFVFLVIALALFASSAISLSKGLLDHADREAPIAIDLPCTAVHVGISDWRDYLDVEHGNMAYLAARLIFDVGPWQNTR